MINIRNINFNAGNKRNSFLDNLNQTTNSMNSPITEFRGGYNGNYDENNTDDDSKSIESQYRKNQ